MRQFWLEFRPLRPDERWYFVGPGGEDPYGSEQGGYKISDTEHCPQETDTDKELGLHAEYDYDIDIYRTETCRERMEPLLAAFAKTPTRDNMPSLKDAEILIRLWWHPSDDREVEEYGLPMKEGPQIGVNFIPGRGSEKQGDSDVAGGELAVWRLETQRGGYEFV